jgi:hypothetical protein
MKCCSTLCLVLFFGAFVSVNPAAAQRLPFERAFDVPGPVDLEVSTIRGKIDVLPGEAGRVVVTGTVTVRVGWDVPANALDLAEKAAKAPPIEVSGKTVRLGPPIDDATRRAVTIAYQVRVPPQSAVRSTSDSGATAVGRISGAVAVRTQSATIDLSSLGGAVTVTTGSGEVNVDGVGGALSIETGSSRITARGLAAAFRVRTETGEVVATLTGQGDVDVETGSSAIRLDGVRGSVVVATRSGRVIVEGNPSRDWALTTGSSNVEVTLDGTAAVQLDAASRSSVRVEHPAFKGTSEKRRASGTIGPGGPLVRITSRSGQIHVQHN